MSSSAVWREPSSPLAPWTAMYAAWTDAIAAWRRAIDANNSDIDRAALEKKIVDAQSRVGR